MHKKKKYSSKKYAQTSTEQIIDILQLLSN